MTRHDRERRPARPLRFDPVRVFFGPTAPGPFGLLGLPDEAAPPERVLEALQARLDQLARHPQSRTPAGEEVSLALHSAAAQLCDPSLQRMLVRTWGGADAEQTTVSPSLERDILLAVGLSGGWNARAMQRVAVACAARGGSIQDVIRVLGRPGLGKGATPRLSTGRRRRRSRTSAGTQSSFLPSAESLHSNQRRDVAVLGAIGFAVLAVLIVLIVLLTPAGRTATNPPAAVSRAPVQPTIPKPSANEVVPNLDSGQPRAVQREIIGATKDLAIDAGAAGTRFKRAYDAFLRSWNLMSPDEIAAIVSSVVDYCYAASLIDTVSSATIADPLRESESGRVSVRSTAGSAAVCGRLLLERELPREFLDELERRAVFARTGTRVERAATFRDGISRNLPAIVQEILETEPASAEAWKSLIEIRNFVFPLAQSERDAVSVLALDSLFHKTQGAPAEFVRPVSALAESLSWQPTPELRGTIFGWLEDSTVPSALLSALTVAMVSSSAPGVDSTMVLQPGAGPDARSALRERLSTNWSEGGKASASTAIPPDFAGWETRANALLDEKPSSDAERLRLAARMGSLVMVGDALRTGQAPVEDQPVQPPPVPGSNSTTLPAADPHSKAIDYYSAGASVQARLEVLRQFSGQRPDTLMADVLISEASRGSPASIREAARKEVLRSAGDPAIVLAALRALPSIPETPENAEWLGQLTSLGGAWQKRSKWKPIAERALLDRACALFPLSIDEVALGVAIDDLTEIWQRRAGSDAARASMGPVAVLEQLQAVMSSRSPLAKGGPGKLNPGDIRRRLDARMVIAQTSMERAVALQSACAEWMALEVAREQPGAIGTVQSLVETWNGERRRAQSSVEQILEGERLMLRLEMLRLQKGAKL